MKLALVQTAVLTVLVAVAIAVGYRPTLDYWGQAGVTSLWAAVIVCAIVAVAAAVPVFVTAVWKPEQVGLAVFAGTTIRLILTVVLAIGCQFLFEVHLRSFLVWLLGLYLLLMAAETVIGVVVVKRLGQQPSTPREG